VRQAVDGIKSQKLLAIILVVSFVVRIVSWIVVPHPDLSTNASLAYLGGADNLVNGKGFADPEYPVFTPPIYAVVIAGFLLILESDQVPVIILQIVLDTCTVFLLYRIAQEIFGWKAGIFASAMWGLYPFAIYATLYVGTETLFTFFLSAFILSAIRAMQSQKWAAFAWTGVLLGLATLTRGATQFLPLVFPLLWFIGRPAAKRWLLNCAVLIAGFTLVILPWGIRNMVVLDDFIPVARAGGVFLWGSSEKLWTIDERVHELPRLYSRMAERGLSAPPGGSSFKEKDKYLFRIAIQTQKDMLAKDPVGFGIFMLKKLSRVWFATESGANHRIVLGANIPLYCLAILGAGVAWTLRVRWSLLPLLVIGYFVILHWLTFPLFRYTLPIIPLVMMFGAVGLVHLLDHVAGAVRVRIGQAEP